MFVVKNFPPLIGGDGLYVQNIAKRLSNRKVIVAGCSGKDRVEDSEKYKFYGSGMIGIKNLNSNFLLRILTYIKLAINVIRIFLKERPDVIHTNSLDLSFIGSLIAYIWGVKHVCTIHGLWGHCPISYGNPLWKEVKGFMEELALVMGKIDTVIGVDTFSADTAHKICKKKVVYLPNGIDFDKLSGNIRKRPVKKRTMLFIGRIVKQKGLDVLIESIHLLKTKGKIFEVLIVGSGSETENLKNVMSEKGLKKEIRFLGKVSNKKIYELYQSCELFVIPSLWEGLPTTLLEAWMFGIPVITTNVGGIGHVAQDTRNAIVIPPGDPEILAKRIDALSSDTNLKKRIMGNGKKDVKEFNWNIIVKKISAHY